MWKARVAVFGIFVLNGIIIGAWSARVPAIARQAHASPGALGLAMLGASIGLVIAASLAGRLCAAFGARSVVIGGGVLCCVALPVLGTVTSVVLLGLALSALTFGIGMVDVSMNVAAIAVVRALDRPLMPVFHAGFSFGAMAGSLTAGRAVASGWSPLHQFVVVGIVGLAVVVAVSTSMPGAKPPPAGPQDARGLVTLLRRPVLWLIGSIMLFSAIAEGASGDWSALFLVRERAVAESTAATGYAVFSVAMAISRLLGERWQRRWGPYRLLTGGATLASIGLFAAALVPWWPVSFLGLALAGAGLAFCFPVALSLAGAAGRRADGSGGEREISFVTTIAYSGFLAGPPVIGAIAQATNLAVAFGAVALVATLIVPLPTLANRAAHRAAAPDRVPARS